MASSTHRSRRKGEDVTKAAGPIQRRAQIVEKASELFDEVGYHTTSMDDIARAVGLAKPTLYHYFDSKDSILLAVHEEFISLLLGRQRARAVNSDRSVSDLLYEVMVDILDLMRTHRGHVRVFFEHHRELPEESRAGALAARDAYFSSVRMLFEMGLEQGVLEGDPQLSAMALFGMCNWAYQWYDPKGRLTTQDVARYFHGVLLHGVEDPLIPIPMPAGSAPARPRVVKA
ncbi:MAG: transcriptional regulator, TetR family [Frankiales bacterium]|nr:transcriptional regulator, TetR family [Frankiales bacterium]